jgi:hypothetical protein
LYGFCCFAYQNKQKIKSTLHANILMWTWKFRGKIPW